MFFLPQFNLTGNLWRPPNAPPAAPDQVLDCQLYVASKGILDITPGDHDLWVPPVYVRFPMGSDVQENDILEVANGDGWFYEVRWTERVHRGFGNEYFMALVEQTVVGPVGAAAVLMESAGYVLLESGDNILLE